MKTSTAYNHMKRLVEDVEDVYGIARLCGQTHEWILETKKARTQADPVWEKLPAWVRERVQHVSEDRLAELYRPKLYAAEYEKAIATARAGSEVKPAAYLRWQLRVDGEHVDSTKISDRFRAGDEDIWKRVEGAHIWNHKPHGEPFSPWANVTDIGKEGSGGA